MKKIILILLLVNVSCSNLNRLKEEESKIKELLITQNKGTFNLKLDTISSFQWDELLIAGPYMNIHSISGYNLKRIPNLIKSHDSFILFCFIEKKEGVKYMEFERSFFNKTFEDKMLNKIYSKVESNFSITKE